MATEYEKQVGLVVWLTKVLEDVQWKIDSKGHLIITGGATAEEVVRDFNHNGLKCHLTNGIIHFD